jgi:hypothetical protein
MKNRRFFLDVNPKSKALSEKIGETGFELIKSEFEEDEWWLNIYSGALQIEGMVLSTEELRALYNILTLEEKEPFDKAEFDAFWERYHFWTHLPKTDKDAAIRYWKRLSKEERKLAFDNVFLYFQSIPDKRFVKKCRTYLGNKNFNDEFKTSSIPSVGRNQSIDDIR